jgi:hypothetical protein
MNTRKQQPAPGQSQAGCKFLTRGGPDRLIKLLPGIFDALGIPGVGIFGRRIFCRRLILWILHNGILKLLRRIGNSIWTLGHISLLDALANTPIRTRQLQLLAPVWDIHRDKQLADKRDFPGQNRKKTTRIRNWLCEGLEWR